MEVRSRIYSFKKKEKEEKRKKRKKKKNKTKGKRGKRVILGLPEAVTYYDLVDPSILRLHFGYRQRSYGGDHLKWWNGQ